MERDFDQQVARFRDDLNPHVVEGAALGIAVSGGPDSLALLLLAAAAFPRQVEAATVDHQLRPGSHADAIAVGRLCETLGVPHHVLAVSVGAGASLQAQAREARYAALTDWAGDRDLSALITAHHSDDQAETLLMRLARGAGLGGLAGVRALRSIEVGGGKPPVALVRPLLGWRKAELLAIVAAAGLEPLDDPANRDPRHDRTRVRNLLAEQDWLDASRIAASATHLAEAEDALSFAADGLFAQRSRREGETLALLAQDLPRELQRRLLLRGFKDLNCSAPRGADLARAMAVLDGGGRCTLGTVQLTGGAEWRLEPAPPRRS